MKTDDLCVTVRSVECSSDSSRDGRDTRIDRVFECDGYKR
jgi:hypothetical protein